jgi:hypothetical protein
MVHDQAKSRRIIIVAVIAHDQARGGQDDSLTFSLIVIGGKFCTLKFVLLYLHSYYLEN